MTKAAIIIILAWILGGCFSLMRISEKEQRDYAWRGGVPCPTKDIRPHQESVGIGAGYDVDNPPRYTCEGQEYECSFYNAFSPVCRPVQ